MPDPGPADRLTAIQLRLRRFREERNWRSLHTPKELAAAISIEAAELQEIFLWRSSDEEAPPDRHRLEDEIADILIFCLNFADVADIDVLRVIEQKIAINEERYPVTKRRG